MIALPRLRRITTSGRFVPEIDGLRCLAIAMVVVYHLDDALRGFSTPAQRAVWSASRASALAQQGHYGVELFFVLSGFILSVPFALHALRDAPRVSLRAYFLRRVTRLEPPYLISLLVRAALLLAFGRIPPATTPAHLAASMFYVHNVAFGEMSTINVVAWSLEVEVQFYILAPVLASVFRIRDARARRALLVACMTGMAAGQLAWMRPEGRAALSLLGYLQYFLAGILLADVYVVDWAQAPRPHALADAIGIGSLGALLAVALRNVAPGLLLPPLILLLYGSVFRGRVLRAIARFPVVVVIGGMCYTIYLWHYSILVVVSHVLRAATFPESYAATLVVQLLLTAPVVLAVSVVLFLAIERPCMRRDWPQRLALWTRSVWRGHATHADGEAVTVASPTSGTD